MSESSDYSCQDNVWLLSYYELTNTYFAENLYLNNTNRGATYSDFAIVNGLNCDTFAYFTRVNEKSGHNSGWPSPFYCVKKDGQIADAGNNAFGPRHVCYGIRPCLTISL